MGRPVAAVALAVLVALAGCSLTAPETETLSPAGVPEPPSTPSPRSTVGPGLSEAGVISGYAFTSAHVEALADRSFTVAQRHVQRYANGTVRIRRVETVRVARNESRYLFDLRLSGRVTVLYGATEAHVQRYANGSLVFERVVLDGEETVRFVRGAQYRPVVPSDAYHGRPFDAGTDLFERARDVRVERTDGGYLLRATGLAGERLQTRVGLVENLTVVGFAATVRSSGLVERRRLTYRGTVDGVRVRGNLTVAYSALGDTEAAPPAWIGRAGEEQAQ